MTGRWPSRVAVAQAGASAAVAALLWGWVVLVALATVLSDSCGDDVAWLVQALAALVSSIAALVGLAILAWWAVGRAPVPGWRWVLRAGLVVSSTSTVAAIVAGVVLPTGACPH